MEQNNDNINLSTEEIQSEEDTSIANQVIDLIKKKYDLIENFNNFKSVLTAQHKDELIDLIDEIIVTESSTIGVLTGVLADVQPETVEDFIEE